KVPQSPLRKLVADKNLDTVWFKIVKVDDDPETVFTESLTQEELAEKEQVRSREHKFRLPKEDRMHAEEMKINALPRGRYALVAASDPTFRNKKRPIVYATFRVSDLSYILDNNNGILVVNRTTGAPVKKAKIKLWKRQYSSSER